MGSPPASCPERVAVSVCVKVAMTLRASLLPGISVVLAAQARCCERGRERGREREPDRDHAPHSFCDQLCAAAPATGATAALALRSAERPRQFALELQMQARHGRSQCWHGHEGIEGPAGLSQDGYGEQV